MKKIILILLAVMTLASSCGKADGLENGTTLKQQGSELVQDWIGLHLNIIKNSSGITHVAYSRHFAYTGIALYEALVNGDKQYRTLSGQLNGAIALPEAPKGKPLFWPAAANAAVAEMLRFFYPAKESNLQSIDSLEQKYFNRYSNEVNNNTELQAAVEFGRQVAAVVIEWSKTDGSTNSNIPYTPLGEGYWEPTPAGYAPANVPGWGNNKTILPGSIVNSIPGAPTAFSKDPGSAFYNMVKELYDISLALTDEQKAIANFWDDAPNGKYVTAFGHWFSILKQVLQKDKTDLLKAADAYLRLGISMNEAAISCWKTKYTYCLLRPVTYIRKHMGFVNWSPLISTPPHPEYSPAHANLSAAAAYALESVFGKNYSFTDHTYDGIGMTARTYSSFDAAGWEAGISRLYGGIHYRPSIDTGNIQGKKVAKDIYMSLKTGK